MSDASVNQPVNKTTQPNRTETKDGGVTKTLENEYTINLVIHCLVFVAKTFNHDRPTKIICTDIT